MTATRPIPSKVARLVPMLGSATDYEALAAARAIGRVLSGAGLGFGDLAAAIPAAGPRRDNITLDRRPGPRPFDVYAWRRAFTPRQEAEHRARVRFCQERPSRLTAWERNFVSNVARLHGNLTIKQGDRLAVIVDRIEKETRFA